MANMTKNSTTGRYELSITPSSSAQTKTIKVAGKYCDCDIDVKVSAKSISYTYATVYWYTGQTTITTRSGSSTGSVTTAANEAYYYSNGTLYRKAPSGTTFSSYRTGLTSIQSWGSSSYRTSFTMLIGAY